MRCISALYCKDDMLSFNAVKHNVMQEYIGSDSIIVSATLRLTNQFSEFYHIATEAKQGLHHIVNQPLVSHSSLVWL